jgi:release factor glutamine methyltransferase
MRDPDVDARAVVAALRVAGCVFAEDEAALLIEAARDRAELAAFVERRVAGLPIEQVVGWADFCGIRVAVEPGVFVPRRRSELLVREAVAVTRRGDVVVDVCCGSGAVGVAVTAAVTGVDLHAIDIDPAAARCARQNVAAVGGHVHVGDRFGPLPETLRGRIGVVVANAPYVPTAELAFLPAEARLHEPPVALDGGADGLAVQRAIVRDAPSWLAPGGHLLVETSERAATALADAFAAAGLGPRVAACDDLAATVVIGRRPGSQRAAT